MMQQMHSNPQPPRSPFTRRSTAEQVTAGLDLSGRTVLITGCASGLGLESMRVLALRGAHVIGAARSADRAAQAARSVGAEITPVACDLADLDSVAACADAVRALRRPLDVLLCNAGVMALRKPQRRYGVELQFLTNHLGHFVLVNRLLDRVLQAPAGRVVVVSSLGHYFPVPGGIGFDNLAGERHYDRWTFYGQSKLANLLMSNELARRLQGGPATCNAVHPGIIFTPLMRHLGGPMAKLGELFTWPVNRSVEQGAATQCYVATAPALAGVSGAYFADCNPARPSVHARNPELAARLWTVSEELARAYL
jgi:WW domain-containing oxidoreductase